MRFSLMLAAILVASPLAAGPAAKPPVPPGVDPGGILITLVGPGVDYTDPKIAARLARDGEGELIGWDLVDNDRRPYADGGWIPNYEPLAARLILQQSTNTRLAFFRAKSEDASLARAISMAMTKHPPVVIIASQGFNPRMELLKSVAQAFPDTFFVIAIDRSIVGTATDAQSPANVLLVSGFDSKYKPNPVQGEVADRASGVSGELGMHVQSSILEHVQGYEVGRPMFDFDAASPVAALAARILAAEPTLKGPELKARILSLAEPLPEGKTHVATHGWIPDPMKHYPLPAAKP